MSCVNTVTIGLDEWEKLKERDRMLNKLESDSEAFAVFEVSQYYVYAIVRKKIVHVGEDILRNMERELKEANERMKAKEDQWQEELQKLRNENTELRRKKWWQLW
jgi:prefoldin subunit 5